MEQSGFLDAHQFGDVLEGRAFEALRGKDICSCLDDLFAAFGALGVLAPSLDVDIRSVYLKLQKSSITRLFRSKPSYTRFLWLESSFKTQRWVTRSSGGNVALNLNQQVAGAETAGPERGSTEAASRAYVIGMPIASAGLWMAVLAPPRW